MVGKGNRPADAWDTRVPNSKRFAYTGRTISQRCAYHFGKLPGGCQRGQLCTFAHSEDDIGKQWVDRDSMHGKVKTVLCKQYQEGNCWWGERCCFAHGEMDLGKPLHEDEEEVKVEPRLFSPPRDGMVSKRSEAPVRAASQRRSGSRKRSASVTAGRRRVRSYSRKDGGVSFYPTVKPTRAASRERPAASPERCMMPGGSRIPSWSHPGSGPWSPRRW